MSGDALLAIGSFVGIVLVRRLVDVPGTLGRLPAANLTLDVPWLLAIGFFAVLALYVTGTYDEPAASVRERGGLLVSSLIMVAFLLAAFFVFGRPTPRTVLLVHAVLFNGALLVWRTVADFWVPIGARKVLVLGSGEDARRAAEALSAGEITGHQLLEWRADLSALRRTAGSKMVIPEDAEDVVFAPELPEDRSTLVTLLEKSVNHEFDLWIVPGISDIVASRVVTKSLGDLPLTPVITRGAGLLASSFRRALDLVLGTTCLLLSVPVLLLATVAVALDSPGKPWLRQQRVGRGGRAFPIWKVRTMRVDAEDGTGPVLAEKNDERTTRVGRFLRKARIDELPQLLLVVSGRMSLIGPRPERPEFVRRFEAELPAYRLRHLLKPGLTGLAQVMGAYATKPDVKLRYDLGYLFHWNPLLDLFILFRTVSVVLRGSGV